MPLLPDQSSATTLAQECGLQRPGPGWWRCFIATAAWGTPMQEDVRYLRAIRDEYLLTNSVGRKFV